MQNGFADQKTVFGVVGLGPRTTDGIIPTLLKLDGVEIGAICDLSDQAIATALEVFKKAERPEPAVFRNYHDLLALPEIEAVLAPTSWNGHLPIAIDAMEAGKYAGIEVGGASSIDELWRLVRAFERTGNPCMLLENCCYGRDALMTLNMVRQGLFGELVYCTGGYEHDLRSALTRPVDPGRESERMLHNRFRNADLYPTHQLGPIAKLLRINRGNRFLTLASTASKARGLQDYAQRVGRAEVMSAKGDIVTTVITCAGGETVTLVHSVSLPRPYSRSGRVQGTRGIWLEDAKGYYIEDICRKKKKIDSDGNPYYRFGWDPAKKFYKKYDHPIWRDYHSQMIGGHGGMDGLVFSAFRDAVQNRVAPPIDTYDCATWMAVTCLSEQSIAMGGHPVAFPDFTNGKWINRPPLPANRWSLDEVFETE